MDSIIDFLNYNLEKRKELAKNILTTNIKWEHDNYLLILDEIYKNSITDLSEQDKLLLCISLLYCGTLEEKERALLNSYYIVSNENKDGIRLLKDYCSDVEIETDEKWNYSITI